MFTALKPSANTGMLVVTEGNAGNATRLQAAQAIWALCGASLTSQLPSGPLPEFNDTSDNAVRSLAALGIVNGTGNGVFSPDLSINDTEIAAVIYNAFIKLGGVTRAKAILNPTYTPPVSGGTATPSPTPAAPVETEPAADNAVSVSYTQTGSTVTVDLPDEKVSEIIEKATDVAVIELSSAADATVADVPIAAITKIADAGLAVEIDLPQGSVTLDTDVASSIAEQVGDGNVSVALEPVEASSLNESQQSAVGDAPVFDISISSGDTFITSFDGARITIVLPYTLKAGESAPGVVVIYVDANGAAERLPTSYNADTGKVTFTTDHLSLYAIAYDESIAAAPAAMPFTDVSESDWFYADVEYAYANGLMNGTTPSTFGSETPVTRAMLVTILYRLEGSPAVTGGASFDDVADGQYYTDAVAWASGSGIVTGVGGGRFSPNGSITRQDMAVILARYAAFKGKTLSAMREADAFTDGDEIADYAREAVTALNEAGLINGANGRVNPRGETPRSQAAALLHRYIEA
ncbi:MAG: S-layer homology domain-containing protein [Oscillospiraceae bacterium]|nr:S-layer homology domain-containing protein [Oscillospiraceae bacterium]